uniref:Uncharacterized protein n=1 Tax=Triticum urartu TaxID=4572 RepID=A0A8R7U4T9_TRIUA
MIDGSRRRRLGARHGREGGRHVQPRQRTGEFGVPLCGYTFDTNGGLKFKQRIPAKSMRVFLHVRARLGICI